LWGESALYKRERRVDVNKKDNVVELFKLHLGNLNDYLKETKYKLPIDYKKAITDYLREIGKVSVICNI
jgi:hypothetical protein